MKETERKTCLDCLHCKDVGKDYAYCSKWTLTGHEKRVVRKHEYWENKRKCRKHFECMEAEND